MSKLTDMTALEKAERLLAQVEASVVVENDPLAKATALIDSALARHAPVDVLAKVQPHLLRQLAQRLNVDPDAPNALAELRKVASARPMFVEEFLNEPLPSKTLGPGAVHTATPEQLAKLAPYRGGDAIVKVDRS
jgi:hypothetical protein